VFIVIPQFLVTALSSVIFAIFDPAKSVLHESHTGIKPVNGTALEKGVANATESLLAFARDEVESGVDMREGKSNSVVYIFR
jgi:solute carrier family 45 protein 1/2/4